MQAGWMFLAAGSLLVAPPADGPARGAAPHDLIAQAVRVAGGIDALRAIHSVRTTSSNQMANIGQEEYPGGPTPLLFNAEETAVIDHDRGGLWIQDHRVPGVGAPAKVTRLILPAVGMAQLEPGNVGGGAPRSLPRARIWESGLQRAFRFSVPDRLLVDAYDAPPRTLHSLPDRTWHGRSWSGVRVILTADTVSLWFDKERGELAALSYVGADPLRGKLAPVETMYTYGNWTRTGNIRLPWTVVTLLQDELSMWQNFSGVQVNVGGLDTLFSTDSTFPLLPPPANSGVRSVNMIAPGVFRLEGTTHTPIAVLQGDSIIVLEAPASPAFVRSMFDSLRMRFPQTPVKAFVVTHHHADHIAGVPAAFDAGLPAIAPAEIAEYVRGLGLSVNEKPARPRRITAIRDSLLVGTGPSRFVLYHVPSAHVSALLMAYFPEPKVLFDIDLAAGSPEDRQGAIRFLAHT